MPEWLHIVISGILAGGILGFRNVLCCFSHLRWPSCLFCLFGLFGFALMAGVVHGTQDAIATNFSGRIAFPRACFFGCCFLFFVCCWLCFCFCFCVSVFCVVFVSAWCLCSAHEAWECTLDYVQVRNCPLLWPSTLTDMHVNLPISFRQVQTC